MNRLASKTNRSIAFVVILLVAAAFVAQNLRLRVFEIATFTINGEPRDHAMARCGWPLPYFRKDEVYGSVELLSSSTSRIPSASMSNSSTRALLVDLLTGILIVVSTWIVVRFWTRCRKRAIQFGVRTLLIVTAAVAIMLALIERHVLDWAILLYLPIGFGIACIIPAAILVCYGQTPWSPRRTDSSYRRP